MKYAEGTKLLIEMIEGESYEGVYMHGDGTRLTLSKVTEYPSGVSEEGTQHFYKMQIASITVIEDSTSDADVLSESNKEKNVTPKISLEEDNFMKLTELSQNYIYIAVVDNQFLEAIKFLDTCSEIAVFGLGSKMARNSKITLLTIATKQQIYLIDVKLCQNDRAFDMGLRNILESKEIVKIVHDSKILGDCLFHSHKTKLDNVFDTQIADYVLRKECGETSPEQMRSFAKCIHNYLNIPESIFNNSEMSVKQLLSRPLTDDKKRTSALSVAYLYVLHKTMQRKMLKEFYQTVECYMNCMRGSKSFNAVEMFSNAVPEVLKKDKLKK